MTDPHPRPPGTRVVVFSLSRAVDDATLYAIEKLRPHATRLIVAGVEVADSVQRTSVVALADECRAEASLDFIETIVDADELVLTGDSWFGPVGDFTRLFSVTDELTGPAWFLGDPEEPLMVGLRDVAPGSSPEPNPATGPPEERDRHLARLVAARAGSAVGVELEGEDLLVPRRALSGDPLELDRHAIAGRWLVDAASAGGYPLELMFSSLVRDTEPRVLYTNAGMLEVLPSMRAVFDPASPLSIVAVVHLYYVSMADELLDRLAHLPSTYDLVVTTSDAAKAEAIAALIDARADQHIGRSEVRVVRSNQGRAESAFFIDCRDVLLDEQYDLVIRLHSKLSPQSGGAGDFFRRELLDNLLLDSEYAGSLVALFQREPGLGAVFPPMIHTGYRTMGVAWLNNREPLEDLCRQLGIDVPIDTASPLAAYGAMFVARRSALAALARRQWAYEEYPAEGAYLDGSLGHVQERILAYAAAAEGFHTRGVANAAYIALSHTALEYKLDRMSEGIWGLAAEQVAEVHRLSAIGRAVEGSRRGAMKIVIARVAPRLTSLLTRLRR